MLTYNRADAEEPYDYVHDLHQECRILPNLSIYLDLSQEFQTDVQIEDGADTNRTKETHEKSLSLLLNLGNVLVHGIHNRRTSKQKYQDSEEDQTVDRDDVVVGEFGPGAHGAEPDEYGDI
jgi:hypothetical protein